MVNKIKLLENLEIKVRILSEEIGLMNEKIFYETKIWLDKAVYLMQEVYEEIKDKYPNEPIIKHIEYIYEDSWDVLYPSSYEENFF